MHANLHAEETLDENVYRRSLLDAIVSASRTYGAGHIVADDIMGVPMNYRQLFTRGFILSAALKPMLADEKNIGVLLPNALGAVVTFVSMHMLAKIPCMLNFSAGEANIVHACKIACVKTVLTSRTFIEKGKLETVIEALEKEHRIIYLEDIRGKITVADKLLGAAKAFFPRAALAPVIAAGKPDDPAVILYTSGSEGTPKGVALSHANILSNITQACLRIELLPSDVFFNALPVFHSFGLTVGMLLPLVRGMKMFLYPSPLHYRIIPKAVMDSRATVMLGTDTFYNGYAHYAEPKHFASVRLAVAGAEKLKESTRLHWRDTLKVDIMQGYGVTETSPAVSFNTPAHHKPGTVGRLFPGMALTLTPVEGLEIGGRLSLKGPNVMLGYLKADRPGVIQPQDEFYDTGDIVDVDGDGFISILGRAKRFAKIAGEMVSLLVVEELAAACYGEVTHASVAIPDERKGEQIILYTEASALTKDDMLKAVREKGVSELHLPRQIIAIESIPRLGNGKIDYQKLSGMAREQKT